MRQAPSGEDVLADQGSQQPGRAQLESVVDDVVGFDFKLPRTVKDLLLRPARVADAALAGDHTRYMRPLRLFLALIALQAIAAGFAGLNELRPFTDGYADDPAAIALLQERLAAAGSSLEQADAVAKKWAQWSDWPLTILATFLFALLIWALRPALGLYRAAMLYVITINACAIITLPLFFASAVLPGVARLLLGAASLIMLAAFIVYMGMLLHRRAADTKLGLGVRIAIIALAWVPVILIEGGLAFGLLEAAFRTEIGVSYNELVAAAEAAGAQ